MVLSTNPRRAPAQIAAWAKKAAFEIQALAFNDDYTVCAVGVVDHPAYIFTLFGKMWVKRGTLTPTDSTFRDGFGYSLSLDEDGTTCAIGAHSKRGPAGVSQGAVYIFTCLNGSWKQQAKLTERNPAAGRHFGISVNLYTSTMVSVDCSDVSGFKFTRKFIRYEGNTAWEQH